MTYSVQVKNDCLALIAQADRVASKNKEYWRGIRKAAEILLTRHAWHVEGMSGDQIREVLAKSNARTNLGAVRAIFKHVRAETGLGKRDGIPGGGRS